MCIHYQQGKHQMETKMPDLMNDCSHSRNSGEDTALRWGCIQEIVPKRISRGQKGRDIILGIKVYFL